VNDTPFPLEATAADAQAAIADEFAFFGDWSERYQYLIDLGRKLPEFPEACKTEEHRLHGCQSMVWIVPSGDASRLDFAAIGLAKHLSPTRSNGLAALLAFIRDTAQRAS
jgi:cysteine desulfuration protein SufE